MSLQETHNAGVVIGFSTGNAVSSLKCCQILLF